MNPAFYGAMAQPLQRIAQGDVHLGSTFVQMHAALIICAVQKGDMHVVKGDDRVRDRIGTFEVARLVVGKDEAWKATAF